MSIKVVTEPKNRITLNSQQTQIKTVGVSTKSATVDIGYISELVNTAYTTSNCAYDIAVNAF